MEWFDEEQKKLYEAFCKKWNDLIFYKKKQKEQMIDIITFDRPRFPSEDTVDGLPSHLDMGGHILISKFQKACIKEGREFKIKVV